MSRTRVVCPKCGVGGANDGPCFCHKCENRVIMLPAVNDRIIGDWPKPDLDKLILRHIGTTNQKVANALGIPARLLGIDPAKPGGDETVTTELKPDMCKCSACECNFKVSDCPSEWGHHDGWEMPAYVEISCPKCEDGGCVDDFFFSSSPFSTDHVVPSEAWVVKL